MNIILIAQIILVFAALMFFHELGHFVFAKRAGIFVREFSIGLGPKLFSIKKGETRYSIRILPFGAYVRMAGEDPEVLDINTGQTLGLQFGSDGEVTDIFTKEKINNKHTKIKVDSIDLEHDLLIEGTDEDQNIKSYSVSRTAMMHYDKNEVQIAPWDRQFGSKSIKDRFAAVLAGPVFNVILAVVLFFIVTLMVGVPTDQVILGQINDGSPAEEAGLLEGDIILRVNDVKLESYVEFIEKIQNSSGKKINLLVDREGIQKIVTVIPEDINQTGRGLIGVQLIQIHEEASIVQATSSAFNRTAQMTALIFDSFRMLFSGQVSMDDISGPVGIMKVTSDAAKQGFATLINWSAILSLYLGIFNLLPIPALDGSRLLFITAEGLRGKPIDPQKESMVHLIGFAFLMLLMIVVTVNDVSKIFN